MACAHLLGWSLSIYFNSNTCIVDRRTCQRLLTGFFQSCVRSCSCFLRDIRPTSNDIPLLLPCVGAIRMEIFLRSFSIDIFAPSPCRVWLGLLPIHQTKRYNLAEKARRRAALETGGTKARNKNFSNNIAHIHTWISQRSTVLIGMMSFEANLAILSNLPETWVFFNGCQSVCWRRALAIQARSRLLSVLRYFVP